MPLEVDIILGAALLQEQFPVGPHYAEVLGARNTLVNAVINCEK